MFQFTLSGFGRLPTAAAEALTRLVQSRVFHQVVYALFGLNPEHNPITDLNPEGDSLVLIIGAPQWRLMEIETATIAACVERYLRRYGVTDVVIDFQGLPEHPQFVVPPEGTAPATRSAAPPRYVMEGMNHG